MRRLSIHTRHTVVSLTTKKALRRKLKILKTQVQIPTVPSRPIGVLWTVTFPQPYQLHRAVRTKWGRVDGHLPL